jgi:outer membrane protein
MREKILSAALFGAAVIATGAATSASAEITPGTVQLRVRVIDVIPNADSGEVRVVGGASIPGSGVDVDDSIVPEVDLTVFVHHHVAIELIAATSEHDIDAAGAIKALGKIADAWVLPPTITVQWQFAPEAKVRPYVGVGLNYSTFYGEESTASLDAGLGGPTEVSLDDSWGWALQAGFDVALGEKWFLNFDLKYIDIDTTATLDTDDGVGTRREVDVNIDPLVVGFGFGYRW